jgi:hypothetical protein
MLRRFAPRNDEPPKPSLRAKRSNPAT